MKIQITKILEDLYRVESDGQYPELTGTEKQVEWADKIRRQHVADMINKLNRLISNNAEKVEKEKANIESIMRAIEGIVNENAEAKFWIENKSQLVAITSKYRRA